MERVLQDGKASALSSAEPAQTSCFEKTDTPFQRPQCAHASQGRKAEALFFPVRHHSPVCSWQLIRMIAAYQPDCILVEGPENANDLIPILTREDTQLPAAIYYFYKDKKQYVSDEGEDFHCYYPFVESSPEMTALREAGRLGIEARFIDLPYSEILIRTQAFAGLRSDQERHSYADDGYLTQGQFYKALCDKTELRSFEEFWEKYFEIAGLRLTPEAFMHQMRTYCDLTREGTPPERMENDGTNAREQHMAYRIQEQMAVHSRILVVTGGFHTPALEKLVQEKLKKPKLHKFTPEEENCYPIAYTYEAADALGGYASGMPHIGFYDTITRRLREADSPEGVYTETALSLLTETVKESAKKDIAVSIADASAAWSLTSGLAALRGAPEPGFAEVQDGVTGALIKGERTLASSLPLDILSKLATGSGVGHIGDTTHVPPLIVDFERQCRTFRFKIDSAIPQEAEVSLFASEREAEKSRFFHRMAFLRTDFCKRLKGPDLHGNTDRARVREVWRYSRSPQVDAALVDHTTDGMTLIEACQNVAAGRIRTERRVEVAAGAAVDCFQMGITLTGKDVPRMDEIIAGDGDFFSLGKGLRAFDMLDSLQSVYGFSDSTNQTHIALCMAKLLSLLPSMAGVAAEQADDCIMILRLLYDVAERLLPERRDDLRDALEMLTREPKKEPSVYGAAFGLLYAMDGSYLTAAEAAMQGYLRGSGDIRKQGAHYLRGLFGTARDIALSDARFLEMTDELLGELDGEEFLEILPSLRLAFSRFTPQEIQTIAARAAALHGEGERAVLDVSGFDEELHAFGAELDAEVMRALKSSQKGTL